MHRTLDQQIARAKELLKVCKHAAMATVNTDGSPHNSPYVFMHDAQLTQLYWGSHPESEHSKNILRTGRLFVVLYEADERGGLYIEATNGRIAEGEELEQALAAHNQRRQSWGQEALPVSYYSGDSPQRMWLADVQKLWVNGTERDANNRVIRDVRTEIKAQDLLN